jgi:hypothetical protein
MMDILGIMNLTKQFIKLVKMVFCGDKQTGRRWKTEKFMAGNGDGIITYGCRVSPGLIQYFTGMTGMRQVGMVYQANLIAALYNEQAIKLTHVGDTENLEAV